MGRARVPLLLAETSSNDLLRRALSQTGRARSGKERTLALVGVGAELRAGLPRRVEGIDQLAGPPARVRRERVGQFKRAISKLIVIAPMGQLECFACGRGPKDIPP